MVDILQTSLAVLCTGLVIKLMDDYLDQELDQLNNNYTLAAKYERRIVPYTLLLFSLAVLCDYKLAIALFWSSYIVGMGNNKSKATRGLKSYQEIIVLLALGLMLLEAQQFLFSLLIILFIHTIDDYIDYYREKHISSDNYINYLGQTGTMFVAVFSLTASLNLNWRLALIIIASTFLISLILKKRGK
ncbi:MAG: hypothetical protein ACQERJ_08655 [Bacillota bacterium]